MVSVFLIRKLKTEIGKAFAEMQLKESTDMLAIIFTNVIGRIG